MTVRTVLAQVAHVLRFVVVLALACMAMGFLARVALSLGRCGAGLGCFW